MSELPRLVARAPDTHKGDAGKVLVVAGSIGMAGAAYLAAKAALRAGAGVVVLACPEPIFPILAAKHTCVMVRPMPATAAGSFAFAALRPLLELARGVDAVGLGPGLGRHPATAELARRLVGGLETRLVLDADGLNAFEGHAERLRAARAPLVLTPHPAELARLLGTTAAAVQADREAAARAYLERGPGVLCLKGHGTLVGEGARLAVNSTGNAGMATAGAGDVLVGVVAALLATGLAPWDAARLGVHLHGRAGDLAAAARGGPGTTVPVPLVATDILDEVQGAIAERLRQQVESS